MCCCSLQNSARGGLRAARNWMGRAASLLMVAFVLAACGDSPDISGPGDLPSGEAYFDDRVSLRAEGGDDQTGAVGSELPELLAVRAVLSSLGEAQPGIPLEWEIADGQGHLEMVNAVTDDEGISRARLFLGGEPGETTVMVRTPTGSAYLFRATAVSSAIASVALRPSDLTLLPGDTSRLSFEAWDGSGNAVPADPIWGSSDPSVASVAGSGLVSGVGAGTATIRATQDGRTATAQVRVEDPEAGPLPPASVEANTSSVVLDALGSEEQLWATVRDEEGERLPGASVEWRSLDSSVATVASNGTVTARKAGVTAVVVETTCCDLADTVEVRVEQVPALVTLQPEALELVSGEAVALVASVTDANGHEIPGVDVRWQSADAAVATVNQSGRVTARSAGSTLVTATSGSASETARVVVDGFASPTSLSLTPGTAVLGIGETLELAAEATDELGNTTDVDPNWSSSNTDIATVNGRGLVTARATGSATIRATLDGVSARAEITVSEPQSGPGEVERVVASTSSVVFDEIGATRQLEAAAVDGSSQPVPGVSLMWLSLDPSIASVNDDGLVTALAEGVARVGVGAPCCGVADTVQVRVEQVPAQVALQPGSLDLVSGEAATVVASVADANGHEISEPYVRWQSADPAVATVNQSGRVTARSAGSTVVTATSGSASETARVVVDGFASPTSLELTPGSADLTAGETQQFVAEAADELGNTMEVDPSWSSSNTDVATVNGSGMVTARGAGSATIRATLDGVSARAEIDVSAPESQPGDTNPVTVDDLRVVSTSGSSVTLRWTEVDNGLGGPARYAVRRGSPTLSWGNPDGVRYLTGTRVGADMELVWEGLQPGTAHEFQTVAYRRDGGETFYSDLSDIVSTSTATSGGGGGDGEGNGDGNGDGDGGGTGSGQVERVVASTSSVVFDEIGATRQLDAAAVDGSGDPVPGVSLMWLSLNPSVASVDDDGLVTALAEGVAQVGVGAPSYGVADTVRVNVDVEESSQPVPSSISVQPGNLILEEGQARPLDATVRDGSGATMSSATVTWRSTNSAVASVNSTGRVTALSAGTTQIEASSGSATGTATLRVDAPAVGGGNGDGGGGGSSGAWYSQRWNYSSTSAMFSDPAVDAQGAGATLMRNVSGLPWGGSNVVRADFPGGGSSYTAGVNLFPPRAGTDRPREMWVEVWVRFDDQWRIRGDHKTLFLLEGNNPAGGNRWEIKAGLWGNTIRGQIQNGAEHEETGCLPPVGEDATCSAANRPNLPSFLWDGQWHRLRWHVEMSSSPNAQDGTLEAWLDGQKFLESRGVDTNSTAGSFFRYMALGRNGDPVDAASIYWGAVTIHTSSPGW